jgi:hypothetical protein
MLKCVTIYEDRYEKKEKWGKGGGERGKGGGGVISHPTTVVRIIMICSSSSTMEPSWPLLNIT